MPTKILPKCKDIEPLIEYLKEKGFDITEVGYKDGSCYVTFQHPFVSEKIEKLSKSKIEYHVEPTSTIKYNPTRKIYDINISKITNLSTSTSEISIPVRDILKKENMDIYVRPIQNNNVEVRIHVGGIKNKNIVKNLIGQLYSQEFYASKFTGRTFIFR